MNVALILFVGGVIVTAFIFFWIRQRPKITEDIYHIDQMIQEVSQASENDAVLVSREHGQLIFANRSARKWIGINGGDPDLELVANIAQPVENFLGLFATEKQASFQLGNRWVEASSHRIPTEGETRTVIVMRELTTGSNGKKSDDTAKMDISLAMAIINQIGDNIDVSAGVENTLQAVLSIVKQSLTYDAGEINLLDKGTDKFNPRGWVGDASYLVSLASVGGYYTSEEGITGWIARHRQPILLRNPEELRSLGTKVDDIPFECIMGVPLVIGDELMGTLELASHKANHFRQKDLALLQAIAKPIAVAINNADLYYDQIRRIEDITTLQRITDTKDLESTASIYEALNARIAQLIEADMSGVFIFDERRGGLVPEVPFHGMHESLIRSVFILLPPDSPQRDIWENQPYWIANDLQDEPLVDALGLRQLVDVAGIRNTAWMPLQVSDRRIGVLAVSNRHDSGFTPRDIQNLQVLAAQAALVVQNIQLAQREHRLDAELEGMREMTYAIGALSHEGDLYAEITERIARLMNIEMCGILLYDNNSKQLKSRLPFYGVDNQRIASYRIDIQPGTAFEELWEEVDFWYSNRVTTDTLVFAAGLEQLATEMGVEKTLMAVLSTGGRRMGVVQVSNKLDGSDFDDNDGRLLTIFATQAATMIENARLFIEVQRSSEQAQKLRKIAELAGGIVTTDDGMRELLAEIAHYMDSEVVFVNVFDQVGNLVAYPNWVYGRDLTESVIYDIYSENFENSVALSHRPFLSNQVIADTDVLPAYQAVAEKFGLEKAILVPLSIGERSLGEIGISNPTDGGDYTKNDIDQLSTIAAQITSTLERLTLYEATGQNLDRRVKELDAISRVSNELTATLDFNQVLQAIRQEAIAATNASGGTAVILRDVKLWQQANIPEIDRRVKSDIDHDDLCDIEVEAIWNGVDVVVIGNYSESKFTAIPEDARSALAAGVMYEDRVVAVIHLFSYAPNAFDDRASTFVKTLATKASLGYGNMTRFEEQQERSNSLRRRVEQLNRIFELGHMLHSDIDPVDMLEAVAYSIQQGVGFDSVLMLLVDEDMQVVRRVTQAGMPLNAFNETQDQTISLENLNKLLSKEQYNTSESYFFPIEKVKDWYSEEVPALSIAFDGKRTINYRGSNAWRDGDLFLITMRGAQSQLLGMICLDRPYNNERPTRNVIEVLEIFAHQAATTLENTRLYISSVRNAEQEVHLNDILEAVASTLNVVEIIEAMGKRLYKFLSYDRFIVTLVEPQKNTFNVIRLNPMGDSEEVEADEDGFQIIRESRASIDQTVLGRAIQDQQDRIYLSTDEPDEATDYQDLASWRREGEYAGMVFPLLTGGECLGAMYIGTNNRQNGAFIRSQNLLHRVTQLVAGGIQNSRLFNQAVELQVLNESVIESIQQGIIVLDQSGRIIALNSFMNRYGWGQDAIGQDVFSYHPDIAQLIEHEIRSVLNSGRPTERINQTTQYADGSEMVRNFYIYPLRSESVVRGAVLLVEDVTERAQLERAMEQRANQLAALTEVSSRITSSLERHDVIVMALEEMKFLIDYDTMSLWRRNGSYMVLEGSAGDESIDIDDEAIRIRIYDYPDVRLIVDTQRVVPHNYDEPLGDAALPGSTHALSWLGVPLVSQGHVVGMITLNSREKHFFDAKNDQNIALAFASQVAIALSNAELFEQTFARTNELGTVLEAAQATSLTRELDEVFQIVVDLLMTSLEMDQCTILILDYIDNALEVSIDVARSSDENRARPKGTVYDLSKYPGKQQAIRDREVVVIHHTDSQDPYPYPQEMEELLNNNDAARMLVPLVVGEETIGLIQLEQHQRDHREMTQQKVRLARALGSQVAIAIENARLSTEMSEMVSESLIINDLTQALSRTFNIDEMIATVRDRVPGVTGAQELYLALYDDQTEIITFPLAVRQGEQYEAPPRKLGDDEVSFVIKKNRFLTIGADYFSPEELRKSLGIKLGEGEGNYKSYMAVPLAADRKVFGVLAIRDQSRMSAFTMNDRRILETVGTQLGVVIQNAQFVEQIRKFNEELEQQVEERTIELEQERDRIDTLYQITSELARTLEMERLQQRALGMVVKAVGGEDGVILGVEPLNDTLFPQAALNPNSLVKLEDGSMIHPVQPLASWLIQQGEDLLVNDLNEFEHWDKTIPGAENWRSAIGVVLESSQNDPQGVMVVVSSRPNAFTEQEERLLVAAGNQVAAAINNAELYKLIRDQAERLGIMLRTEQEEAEKNSAILESIADGVILTDANGQIIQFNSAAERILGLPREQTLGQSMSKFTGLYGADASAWAEALRENPENRIDADMVVDERLTLGDTIVNVQVSPVYTAGIFLGMVSVFRDITRDVEVDRMKGEFISNVSHEFRTPLTSIKGFTEFLLMGATGELNDAQLRTLRTIKDNVNRLTVLVEDVLDISKIDSGKYKLNIEKLDLLNLLNNVLEKIQEQPPNQAKNLDVSLIVDANVPHIEADNSKLNRIMLNLVDNAFNYTLEGGSIEIRAQVQKNVTNKVLITVSDTGIGIAEEFRQDIWQRFQRYEDHVLQLDVAGTGLGLSIVKEMVELHYGDIWFESELGKGTTFFVSLPIEQPTYSLSRSTQTMSGFSDDEV